MNDKITNRLDEFIQEIDAIKLDGNDKKRVELSNKIGGFIRAVSGEKRCKEYFRRLYLAETFDQKISKMKNTLIILREEARTREMLGVDISESTMDSVKKKAKQSKVEAERRKNVAEFKYWGFAIELIETVRREFRDFRQTQEELLNEIKILKEQIKMIGEGKK